MDPVSQSHFTPQFLEDGYHTQQQNAALEMDMEMVLFGSLLFLGVIFLLGLVVNLPAALIYCRSRQIRELTDKFILFVLIVDFLSLLILIPISFLYVLEYSASVVSTDAASLSAEIPVAFADAPQKVYIPNGEASEEISQENSDFVNDCVQQWILIVHRVVFFMAANLSVLGALKIAVERYLAVVAPLHYHKILKSSVIFFVSLFSFVLSLACAVITSMDPADFSWSLFLGSQCTPKVFSHSSSLSMQMESSENVENSQDTFNVPGNPPRVAVEPSLHFPDFEATQSSASANVLWWWWPVLKLFHATVFFLVPVTVMLFMYLRIRTEACKQNYRMSYRNKSSFILPPPTTSSLSDSECKKPVGFNVESLHQVFGKFKLVQRLRRKTRVDRAARVAFLTIGLVLISFGPLFYVQIASAVISLTKSQVSLIPWVTSRDSDVKFAPFLVPTLLACLHPLLSPLVYVYRYKRVRSELKALLRKLISSCCWCCWSCQKSTSPADCQDVVRQFNQLASQRLPSPARRQRSSPLRKQQPHQMQESQSASVSQTDSNETAITIDRYYDDKIGSLESVGGDCSRYLFYGSVSSSSPVSTHAQRNDSLCEEDPIYDEDDLMDRPEADFSDMENHLGREENAISVMVERPTGFFSIFNNWMSSYSRRWNQHRESVTSTASFITLLSNRRRSIPADTGPENI